MKHNEVYEQLISRAKSRLWTRETAGCYVESHHIIPRSLEGTDDPENLVFLTAREHYIAHLLLAKIHKGTPAGVKMSRAIVMMMGTHLKMHITSRFYAVLREDHANELGPRMSELHKGVPKTAEHAAKIGRSGESNAMFGKTHSTEARKKLSMAHKGRKKSDTHRENIRQANLGKTHSEETKALISRKKTGVPQSPEHAAKTRTNMLGKKQSDHQKNAVREANQATWELTDPEGTKMVIVNLRQFCIDHGLDQGNMVAVSKGRLKAHKKWKCTKLDSVPKVA